MPEIAHRFVSVFSHFKTDSLQSINDAVIHRLHLATENIGKLSFRHEIKPFNYRHIHYCHGIYGMQKRQTYIRWWQ